MKSFNQNDIYRNNVTYYPKYKWISDISGEQGPFYPFGSENRYPELNSQYTDLYELNVNSLTSAYQYIVNKKQYTTYAGKTLSDYAYGEHITGSLFMTSSITTELISENGSRTHINALKNTLNYYTRLSPSFDYSNFQTQSLISVFIPSIFYGSCIKKGSVVLSYYEKLDNRNIKTLECKDLYSNGELINITSSFYGTSSVCVGNVLYNEGVIILNKSNHFSQGGDNFILEYNGTIKQNQITLFATADKNEYNNSNNPTFKNTLYKSPTTSSSKYIEDSKQLIYNINSSSYSNYEEDYKKITYISSIGIFDKDRNLIAIAKLSKPLRKRQEDSFTFKLKYDMI